MARSHLRNREPTRHMEKWQTDVQMCVCLTQHDFLGSPSSFHLVEAPLNEEVMAKLDESMRIPDSTEKWCVAYVHCLVEPTTNGAIRVSSTSTSLYAFDPMHVCGGVQVRRGGPGKNQLMMFVRFDDAEPPSDKTPRSAGGMGKQPPMSTSVDLPTRSSYHLTCTHSLHEAIHVSRHRLSCACVSFVAE